jgi:hypothetical protein
LQSHSYKEHSNEKDTIYKDHTVQTVKGKRRSLGDIYGICLYYNDEYAGGELEYSELGIIHKPKARSLVLHGGNILHKSLSVLDDLPRYFSTTFVRGSKDSPVLLNKELFSEIEEHDGSTY